MLSRPRFSSALLLALALAGPTVAEERADNGIIATEWSVRQQVEELLDDLGRRAGDLPTLLDRTQNLLKDHGDRPYFYKGRFVPIREAVAGFLAEQGLDDDFQAQFETIAKRRLAEAEANGSEAAIKEVARQFPGTDAAVQAWRKLADASWDSGRLGLYLAVGQQAGEADDELRAKRLEAARSLLLPEEATELPGDLDALGKMWREEFAGFGDVDEEAGETRQALSGTVRFSEINDAGLMACSNGSHLAAFDPLVGKIVGGIHRLGGQGFPRPPAVAPGGRFIALAGNRFNQLALVCIGSDGEEQWRSTSPYQSQAELVSAPVVLDRVVAFAILQHDDDGAELRIIAHRLDDGEPAWDVAIATNTNDLNMRWGRREGLSAPPNLTVHRGLFAVCSNNGMVATVGSDGDIRNLWVYGGVRAGAFTGRQGIRHLRTGNLASDGRFLVVAPGDSNRVYIAEPGQSNLVEVAGDGSRDVLVDVRDGKALLVGDRITLLDASTALPHWSRPFGGIGDNQWGRIGDSHVLVTRGNRIAMHELAGGEPHSVRSIDNESRLAVANGVLIEGREQAVTGFGNKDEFQASLLAAAAARPDDYKPLVALHSLSRLQGDLNGAYQQLRAALERGAPARFAEQAAQLVRWRIDLALGSDEFPPLADQMRELIPHLGSVSGEILWWTGRHHEVSGDTDAAIAAFQAALEQETVIIPLNKRLRADLHALAEAGLARLGAGDAPAWMRPASQPDTVSGTGGGQGWKDPRPRLGQPILAGSLLVDYIGGRVRAQNLEDGSDAWVRPGADLPPMLGIFMAPEPDGIRVRVIPGTAADGAGFKDEDLLTAVDGQPVNDSREVQRVIGNKPVGAETTFTVMRPDDQGGLQELELKTELGERVSAVVASSRSHAVVQRMTLSRSDGIARLLPDFRDPILEVISLGDGSLTWRRELPPTQLGGPERDGPLLTDDGRLLMSEGDDLVAFSVQDGGNDQVLWRIPGAAADLRHLRLVEDRFLVMGDEASSTIRLIDLEGGRTLFELPDGDATSQILLDEGQLILNRLGGRLTAWDLGRGMRSWASRESGLEAIARTGDGVVVLTQPRRMKVLDAGNGRERRQFGDWSLVEDVATHGDRLYLHGRKGEFGQVIAAVGLAGGTTIWERQLPGGVEIRGNLQAGSHGVAAELVALGLPASMFVLDAEGNIDAAHVLPTKGMVIPSPAGLLVSGQQGLSLLPEGLPERPEPLVPAQLPAIDDLKDLAGGPLPDLPWRSVGKARYAIARSDGDLLVFVRLEPTAGPLELRFGDSGPVVDRLGQQLTFSRGGTPAFVDHPEGWLLDGLERLPGEEGEWLGVARLTPPALRQPGAVLELRAGSEQAVDGPSTPWWLRQGWRRVVQEVPAAPEPAPGGAPQP